MKSETMSKTKYVEAYYTQAIRFDVDDIDWDDVANYYVEWTTLYIELKNGEVIKIDNYDDYEIDWKRPDDVRVFEE